MMNSKVATPYGHSITCFFALILFVVAMGFAVRLLFSKNMHRWRLGKFLTVVTLMMIVFFGGQSL